MWSRTGLQWGHDRTTRRFQLASAPFSSALPSIVFSTSGTFHHASPPRGSIFALRHLYIPGLLTMVPKSLTPSRHLFLVRFSLLAARSQLERESHLTYTSCTSKPSLSDDAVFQPGHRVRSRTVYGYPQFPRYNISYSYFVRAQAVTRQCLTRQDRPPLLIRSANRPFPLAKWHPKISRLLLRVFASLWSSLGSFTLLSNQQRPLLIPTHLPGSVRETVSAPASPVHRRRRSTVTAVYSGSKDGVPLFTKQKVVRVI